VINQCSLSETGGVLQIEGYASQVERLACNKARVPGERSHVSGELGIV